MALGPAARRIQLLACKQSRDLTDGRPSLIFVALSHLCVPGLHKKHLGANGPAARSPTILILQHHLDWVVEIRPALTSDS